MRNDLSSDLVTCALGMAVALRRPRPGTIHHSDQGSQYGSLSFGKTLRESEIIPSMGSKGDPQATRLRRASWPPRRRSSSTAAGSKPGMRRGLPSSDIRKVSTIPLELPFSASAAGFSIFRYIEGFYNPKRRLSALSYKSPAEYKRMLTEEEEADMTAATS